MRYVKARELVTYKTGKLDSNAAEEGGRYPFFTCAQTTYRINRFAFDTECVLLAGNNAGGIFPLKYFKGKFNAYQRTYVIEPRQRDALDIKYFYYFLRPYLKAFEQQATGATTKFLTLKILNGIDIALPSIDVQRQIAAILSAYDDLIENNRRRIALLEKMAEEIYREWFVRLRFPGHENAKFEKGLPIGWKVDRLNSAATFKYGYTESSCYDQELPKFLRVMDINKASYIDWSDVPNCLIGDAEFGKYRLMPNDLVIARMADPGKVAIIEEPIDAVFASYLIKIDYDQSKLTPYYLFYMLRSEQYAELFASADSGSTRGSINGNTIGKTGVLFPTSDLVQMFEATVRPVRSMLTKLQQECATLRTVRDALLPRLISGKLSVDALDIHFPPSMQLE